jgi:hypothetical protein
MDIHAHAIDRGQQAATDEMQRILASKPRQTPVRTG